LISHEPHFTSYDFLLPAIGAGVLGSFSAVLQFKAYKDGEASLVAPIANLLPILLVVTSFLILGVKPNLAGLVGIFFVVGGVYYSSVSGKHDLLHPLQQILKSKGSRAMLVTVFLWSIQAVLDKIALATASPAMVLVTILVTMFIGISAYLLFQPQKHRLRRGEKVFRKWGWHIVAISVFVTLSVMFQLQAIKTVDPSYVLSVKRLDVLMTVIFSGLFLHERHIMKRIKGSAIALVGVVIIFLLG
jgi:transporter family protein